VTEQWTKLWRALSLQQRISIGLVGALVLGGIAGFAWWKGEQDFKPVFRGMEAEDAGAIVGKLKESGTEFRLADNGATVLVRTDKVAETRLQLASAGLPKTGRIGFELFDKANLGTTDFAEQVNYRRALEGEIERTIKSVAEVEQARVHLTFPKDSVFLESRLPAKASVLLTLNRATELTPQNVNAIKHLVASAVEGLAPDAVSIMDQQGNLLSRPKMTQDPGAASDELIEYKQRIERDLIQKVNSTLEPLLGYGRFRTGISVDCDITSGEQSEETYDPEKSVMTNSTKTEESNSSAGQAGGVPGTASNLPRATGRTSGAGAAVMRRSETIAYQSSRTVKRLKVPQGGIKRVSAAVLLDQSVRWEGSPDKMRRVLEPPSAESMRAIKELVAAAIGFTPARGDQLVVESLPFESTLQQPPPSAPPVKPQPDAPSDPWSLRALEQRRIEAVGLLCAIALAAFWFLRKRKKTQAKFVETKKAITKGQERAALDANEKEQLEAGVSKRLTQGTEAPAHVVTRVDSLVESLRTSIGEDPALAASVLRTWLEERNG
jgi:flagellar M-ring protein FliF